MTKVLLIRINSIVISKVKINNIASFSVLQHTFCSENTYRFDDLISPQKDPKENTKNSKDKEST